MFTCACICQVNLRSSVSCHFTLERGIRQGKVLSPALFLLMMDPLLTEMERRHLGPGLFLGVAAHADDVRAITSSLQCLEEQVHHVQSLGHPNGLSLNVQKCDNNDCNTNFQCI